MGNKLNAHKYFGKVANTYGDEYYKSFEDLGYYPANYYRLEIIKKLLKKIKPTSILDIGCGTADPLIALSKEGYNIFGFDYSDSMVQKAKKNLNDNNIDSNRVWKDNMENIVIRKPIHSCSIALGSLYYANNFNKALKEMISITKKKGDLIFSLRNELFSLFTLNKYSLQFFKEKLLDKDIISKELYNDSLNILQDKLNSTVDKTQKNKINHKNIDELNVKNIQHNPLLISEQIKLFGLKLKSINFYHYHSVLPELEKKAPIDFYNSSSKLEEPSDWRGNFMASAFVVHAVKV